MSLLNTAKAHVATTQDNNLNVFQAVNYHPSNYYVPIMGSPEMHRMQLAGRTISSGPELQQQQQQSQQMSRGYNSHQQEQPLSAAHKNTPGVDISDAGPKEGSRYAQQTGSFQVTSDTDLMRLHSFSTSFSNEANQPLGSSLLPLPLPRGNINHPQSPNQGDTIGTSVFTVDLSPMNSFSDSISPLPSFSFLSSALDMHQLPNLSSSVPSYRSLPRPPCLTTIQLYTELPPQPTVERAQQCLAEFDRRHPAHAVLVLNTLAGASLTELYIAQSDSSLPWIGPVARSHSGIARALVGPGEVPNLVRIMLLLAQGVFGAEVDTMCRIILVDGAEQLVRLTLWQCDRTLVCVGARLA